VLHMIGSRPAMMATTVIIFGRTRSTAPSILGVQRWKVGRLTLSSDRTEATAR
jgi:hypothetical protein